MASVLSALDAQQASVPEAQRGLAPELSALSGRLAADPALENDPRFGVEVAWLVQDWQHSSGTGQAPALPPVLLAGMRAMAQELPGLQNADLKALLSQTATISDRNLIRDIRQQALRVAAMPPAEQTAIGPVKTVAVLEYRLSQAAEPAPAPAHAPPAVDPSAMPGNPPAATPTPASAAVDQSMRIEDRERADMAEQTRPSASSNATWAANPPAAPRNQTEFAPAVEPEGADKTSGRDGNQAPPAGAFTPPPAQTSPAAQMVADTVAQAVGGMVAPIAGVVQGIGRGLAGHAASTRAQSDRRTIDTRADELRAANRTVETNLDTVREQGRPFFDSFDKAVAQAGGDAQQVITDMAPGRPHEALHQELKDTLAKTPAFAEAWKQLKSSTGELGRHAEFLRVEAHRRGMGQDPTVVESEQAAAKTGWKLTNLPGVEAGKNFVQEASRFVEMLVERLRDFLSRAFGRGEERNQCPSPGR
jgi:hypothetical protein